MHEPARQRSECDAAGWDRLARLGGRVRLQQSFVYGEAMAAIGRRVVRSVIGNGQVLQAVERPLAAGARVVLANRGPLPGTGMGDPRPADLHRAVRASFGRCLLLWSPLRWTAGLGRPVVTGYATVWIDLRLDGVRLRGALTGKWRNQLVRAEGRSLTVRQLQQGPEVAWLAGRHEAHRAEIGYRALPVRFLERMAAASIGYRDRLVLIAEHEGRPVAGIWLQMHHGSATYLIGYADEAGRRTDAMRLLLWQGMLALRERGIGWLDLGGIATDRAPGLSRFKFGMGGEVTVEPGTYFRQLVI